MNLFRTSRKPMKQITVRLNEQGEAELKKIQELTGQRSAQAAIEFALIGYRVGVDHLHIAEKKLRDAEAVIEYLEAQLKARG